MRLLQINSLVSITLICLATVSVIDTGRSVRENLELV